MNIYIVRHTSVGVEKGVCYGISDVPLSERFLDELSVIQGKLSNVSFDKVYSSPLSRCVKLTEKLCNKTDLTQIDIKTDKRITEMDFGHWEMMNWDDIDRDQMDKWGQDFVNVRCPNGESYLDLYNRALDFYSEITNSNLNYDNILVVTHSGVIRSILSHLRGIDLDKSFEFNIEYGEVVKINVEDNTTEILK